VFAKIDENEQFQSLIGTIKTRWTVDESGEKGWRFQSLIGTIKTKFYMTH